MIGFPNEITEYCDAPVSKYPNYIESSQECIYGKSLCPRNEKALYQNNQCTDDSLNSEMSYSCLNRMNINETLIKSLSISYGALNSRKNLFDYFDDFNKTHLKCGKYFFPKKCSGILDRGLKIECTSKSGNLVIVTDKDICLDFSFLKAMNFPQNEIERASQNMDYMIDSNDFQCNGFEIYEGYSNQILNQKFLCDGRMQCKNGEDENITLCSRYFPHEATFPCYEKFRPGYFPIEILAVLCDGTVECQDGADEKFCDFTSLTFILTVLGGYSFLIFTVFFLYLFGIKDKKLNSKLDKRIFKSCAENFYSWHTIAERRELIEFKQGGDSSSRRLWNRTLMDLEMNFHNNERLTVLSCLKVCFFPIYVI